VNVTPVIVEPNGAPDKVTDTSVLDKSVTGFVISFETLAVVPELNIKPPVADKLTLLPLHIASLLEVAVSAVGTGLTVIVTFDDEVQVPLETVHVKT
jgi:hypothetical protein